MWESRDAIKAFAGEDIEAAVLYPEDEKFLVGESTIARSTSSTRSDLGRRRDPVGPHQQRALPRIPSARAVMASSAADRHRRLAAARAPSRPRRGR